MTAAPLALSIENAAAACDVSVQTIRAAIKTGELAARFAGAKGGKTIIPVDELRAWVDSLPSERGTK